MALPHRLVEAFSPFLVITGEFGRLGGLGRALRIVLALSVYKRVHKSL